MPNIKISDLQTQYNPRGKVIHDDAFRDLVSSIVEKGVLVPLIVRPDVETKKFSVVAGHRRLAASVMAGLKEIPCQVMKLNDQEAAEVAIIENLQRQEVHPIDEGEAYRRLHEAMKMELKDIAVRVGKDLKYVKKRLYLTNLTEPLRNQYRVGQMKDGHAELISRLAPTDQALAFKAMKQGYSSVPELGDWIKEHLYAPLEHQPWLGNLEAMKAVGACTTCPQQKDGLFLTYTAGACVDMKCWRQKMAKYIEWLTSKNPTLGFISNEYGNTPKGIIPKGQWVLLNKKTKCDSAHSAVVVEGPNLGDVMVVCSDPQCKMHGRQQLHYERTPKEKARRQKEVKAQKAKHELSEQKFKQALNKLHAPLNEKYLDVILSILLSRYGTAILRPIAKRHEWEVEKKVEGTGDYKRTYSDFEGAIKKYLKDANIHQKAQLIAELIIESNYPSDEHRLAFAKMV